MALLIHMARYEVVERTEVSREVIATTACGMYVGKDISVSVHDNHVTCLSCLNRKR
jgi:hypothetical protein